jgi:hypothetical protein
LGERKHRHDVGSELAMSHQYVVQMIEKRRSLRNFVRETHGFSSIAKLRHLGDEELYVIVDLRLPLKLLGVIS